ncbi:MAG: carbohydrate ABC transporter permease, partial [Anaerolineae bacterium]|nr:carbohydrate ABC transporter permease [Anaerolineae bacterium]
MSNLVNTRQTFVRLHKMYSWKTVVIILILLVGALLMIAPFVWITQAAFAGSDTQVYQLPPRLWPLEPTLDNFPDVFRQVPFALFILNSLKVAGLITIGQLITCSTAAYAFARLDFPGKNILFILLLSAMMIPLQVTIVPLFILMRRLDLYNTHWSLILPPLVSPFGVFLLRQYFSTIPRELEDAARIDGANAFTIFWRIILPLARPALTTLGILAFVFWWNDFLVPLIMINKSELQTLPVGLILLRGRFATGSLGTLAAG